MRCFIWYSFLQNFYPRPPRGGRPDGGIWKLEAKKFLSTPSARRATPWSCGRCRWRGYFYPRPPRGGRHVPQQRLGPVQQISIHALREEGDPAAISSMVMSSPFLSTPSARRATASSSSCTASSRFLSTPSARRATSSWSPCGGRWRNFYPRPPRGGRRSLLCSFLSVTLFLSTPSARRATEPYPGIDQNLQDFYPRPPRGGRR